MIVLDVPEKVRDELIRTLFDGVTHRVTMGHPPSDELKQVVRILSGQESSGALRSPQPVAEAEDDGHGGNVTKAILSRREAAEYLSVSVAQLDRLRRDQGLPTVALGARRVGFRVSDLDAWSVKNAR